MELFFRLTPSASFVTLWARSIQRGKQMLFKIGIVIGILLVLAAGPLLIVWSLNTLFPALVIPYTIDTWAAAVLLGGLLSAKFK